MEAEQSFVIMADTDIVDCVKKLKETLELADDASDSDAEDIGECRTNLGNKLKRGARYVSRTSLDVPSNDVSVRLIEQNGEKHALVVKRRKLFTEIPDENYVLEDINVDKLLRPISDPAEVPDHPALSDTFSSTKLDKMSSELMDVINVETGRLAKLRNLLSAFLGDDATMLDARKMVIPEGGGTDIDRFFMIPQVEVDRNLGLDPDHAEELRQLLQVASQRMQEYVRCIFVVRSGIEHTLKRRRRLRMWCHEMNNQDWVELENGVDEWGEQMREQQALEDEAARVDSHVEETAEEKSD